MWSANFSQSAAVGDFRQASDAPAAIIDDSNMTCWMRMRAPLPCPWRRAAAEPSPGLAFRDRRQRDDQRPAGQARGRQVARVGEDQVSVDGLAGLEAQDAVGVV